MPMLFGLASAVLTVVGAAVGAGDIARARAAARDGAWFGAAVTGVIGLVASAFPTVVLDQLGAEPAAYSAGATYLQTVGPLYGVFGFGFVYTFACLGAGRTLSPLVIAAIRAIAAGLAVAGAIVWYPLNPASISAAAAVSPCIKAGKLKWYDMSAFSQIRIGDDLLFQRSSARASAPAFYQPKIVLELTPAYCRATGRRQRKRGNNVLYLIDAYKSTQVC